LAEDVLGQAFAVVVLAVYIWRAVTLLPPPTALFSFVGEAGPLAQGDAAVGVVFVAQTSGAGEGSTVVRPGSSGFLALRRLAEKKLTAQPRVGVGDGVMAVGVAG
jgi:hypothetical protein